MDREGRGSREVCAPSVYRCPTARVVGRDRRCNCVEYIHQRKSFVFLIICNL